MWFLSKEDFEKWKANDFAHVKREIKSISAKVDKLQWWIISTLLAIVLTLIAIIAQVRIPIIFGD